MRKALLDRFWLAFALFCGSLAPLQATADATNGSWGPVIPWPHIAVSMANLPDGRVLTWSGSERDTWPDDEQTYSATWNPETGEFIEIFHEGHNMFCSHLSLTENGEVFVNGGRNRQNSPWTSLFDYRDSEWVQIESMVTGGRWYPTTQALPSGEILTSMGESSNLRNPERWSPERSWEVLNGIDYGEMRTTHKGMEGGAQTWPHLFVTPVGEVFHFWTPMESHFMGTDGVGSFRNANAVSDSPDYPPGVAIQYDDGKILVAGGNQGSWDRTSRTLAFVIDLNGPSPQINATGPMNFPRRYPNLVSLPTGEVLVIGGNTSGLIWSDEGTVYEPEIWNPATGNWRVVGAMDIPRNYHSTAALLTDGRVLAAGGGYRSSESTEIDHQDGQVFTPPYLYAPGGGMAERPAITSAPGFVTHGDELEVSASPNVARFTMIRMSAVTHAVNTDTRFHEVAFSETSPGQYTLSPSTNPNLMLAGYWMLFAIDAAGVPSEAQVVRVQRYAPPEPWRYVRLTALSEGNGGVSAAVAELGVFDENGEPISRSGWNASASSERGVYTASRALDGDPDTFWQSASRLPHPHDLIVDLGVGHRISGISYLPRGDSAAGRIADYEVRLSADGTNWSGAFATGTFDSGQVAQEVLFDESFPLSEVEIAASAATATGTELSFSATPGMNLEYQYSFGDGTPPTVFSPDPTASHTFATPGRFNVVVTVRDLLTGEEQSINVTQIVRDASIDPADDTMRRLSSTSVVFHPTRDEIWNVNPDNDSATAIDASTLTKLVEIPVGSNPRSLAVATDGRIWVVSKDRSEIHAIDPASQTVTDVFFLSEGVEGRSPHGIVFSPSGTVAYTALEDSGEVLEIDATSGAILRVADVGPRVRHLGVSRDGTRLYISRFITPPVPGEDSALPNVAAGGGELIVLETDDFASQSTILLHHSDDDASENTGPGLPNYLGPPAMSPNPSLAYVPSKQDNILGGAQRPGQDLDFDHTVRAISSRIDLVSETESTLARIDHDNASVASHAVFGPHGFHLFTSLEGNRAVAISDTLTGSEIVRFDVGRAPQGLALSPDGHRLAVHNFMDRSVEVIDVSDVIEFGGIDVTSLGSTSTVANEALAPPVFLGKQHFYDARDDRLAGLDYMACASCHNAAGSDGRTWDFTQFGEGLRTTIGLEGRGQGHGPLHWTANFDEVQDFEGQIRSFALGLGLMSDEDFFDLDRSDPLGAPKAGLSPDLDALAAYVESLDSVGVSPFRQSDGSLSPEGAEGRALFTDYGCDGCHSGAVFTDSEGEVLHDVGTLTPDSGPQTALDTPSLLGLWSEGPYLHDGSAATLPDAIEAHSLLNLSMSEAELSRIAAYVSEIDDIEAASWTPPDSTRSKIHHGVIADVGSSWQQVTLPASYTDMVVVASLAYDGSWLPAVARVRNAVGNGFELRVQNPSDEELAGYTVSYLVAEAGSYTQAADGITFEAVKVLATGTDQTDSWVGQQEFYANAYTNPVVIGQVMTENDVNWSAFWASNGRRFSAPSSSKLYVGKHVGEDPNTTRAPETLGYMVFEAGIANVGAVLIEAGITPDIVDGVTEPADLWIEPVMSESGTAVVSLGSMDGNDGGWAVRYGGGAFEGLELAVAVDEDQLQDNERRRSTEQVAYVIAGSSELPTPPVVFETRVASGADDAEEGPRGGTSITSRDLELVEDQTVGMRFTGVEIPAGAVILEAWLQFQADETGSGAISLTIQAEAADDAVVFTTRNANISRRPRTTATAVWSPPAWPTKNVQGPDQQTSDISAVIQEIVDRPGWSSGNALAIIVTGTGTRTAESYEGKPAAAPLLHVLYEVP